MLRRFKRESECAVRASNALPSLLEARGRNMLNTLRSKNLHTWGGAFVRHRLRHALSRPAQGARHLLFALCDHFEPLWGGVGEIAGRTRVQAWMQRLPAATAAFRDAEGKGPQHTFFFPGEQFHPSFFDRLDRLVRLRCGEIELHLHHDGATRDSTRACILAYCSSLSARGHLARDRDGRPRYAFVHGNWALANGRPDGRMCGVDDEVPLLFETGCYADFTFPSAPDITQPDRINELYWPTGDLTRARCYEHGELARVGKTWSDRILIVQGPLALTRRPRSAAIRIENGAITANDPATPARVRSWAAQGIHVRGRPEWVFVKVHTHGAPEKQAESLLGEPGRWMHETLAREYNDGACWVLHYVTAREMFNIAMAAMQGCDGDPGLYRDWVLPPPPILSKG